MYQSFKKILKHAKIIIQCITKTFFTPTKEEKLLFSHRKQSVYH